MSEVELVTGAFEHVSQPLPAVGRLQRDLGVIAYFLQQLEKRSGVVADPA